MRTQLVLAVGVILTACARQGGDGETAGAGTGDADSVATLQARGITVGDTSASMSPDGKSSADEPPPRKGRRATDGTPSKSKDGTPAPDSALPAPPHPPAPRPGMRPTARDRQPWQVPTPDDTIGSDSARPSKDSPTR